MKLHTSDTEILRSDDAPETTFKIQASAKAFMLLSRGLYSDKIAAPIRELSCNAYDAHVMVGKQNVPIEVKLPNSMDPTFYVKDFGPGLSEEDIIGCRNPETGEWEAGLYSTYFASTKTDSNDLIGALGLGSKSPLAYTENTFNVESRQNGKKRLYTIFVNERGEPTVRAMTDYIDTDEESGLTVSFTVKSSDFGAFYVAARRQLMYFTPQPNVIGWSDFKSYDLKHTIEGSNWKIRHTEYNACMSGAYAVQGFVAYPIDVNMLVENGLSEVAATIARTNIDIFVPIGSVEFAPSREALSYDKLTIKALVDTFEAIVPEIVKTIQQSFDDCKTLWEARLLYATIGNTNNPFSKVFNRVSSTTSFTYGGIKLRNRVAVDMSDIKNISLRVYSKGTTGKKMEVSSVWDPLSSSEEYIAHASDNAFFVVDDIKRGSRAYIEQYATNMASELSRKSSNGRTAHVCVISPVNKTLDMKDVQNFLDQLGGYPVVLLSKLGLEPSSKPTYQYKKRALTEALSFTEFPDERNRRYGSADKRRVFSRLTWKKVNVDLNAGGFYMPLERFNAIYKGQPAENLDRMMDSLHTSGVFSSDELETVYGMTAEQIAALDPSLWSNFFDVAEKRVEVFVQGAGVKERLIAQHILTDHDHMCRTLITNGKYTMLKDCGLKQSFERISAALVASKAAPNISATIVNTLSFLFGAKDVTTQASQEYYEMIKEMLTAREEFSMLRFVNWATLSMHDATEVVTYINTMIEARTPTVPYKEAA